MRIQLSNNTFLEYTEGEWHIILLKSNKDGSYKEKTEYYGDIGRCMSALSKYDIEPSIVNNLIFEYKKSLRSLLFIKKFDEEKVLFNSVVGNDFSIYYDATKSNVILDFSYSTDHGMSESGIKKGRRFLTSFYQASTYTLGIETGESLRNQASLNNVDDFYFHLNQSLEKIKQNFS